jgi:hypothetical protein
MSDPYHDAAFLFILLQCDHCQATLESDELRAVPIYPEEGWNIALGNAARERGWAIRENGEFGLDYSVTCRSCASK